MPRATKKDKTDDFINEEKAKKTTTKKASSVSSKSAKSTTKTTTAKKASTSKATTKKTEAKTASKSEKVETKTTSKVKKAETKTKKPTAKTTTKKKNTRKSKVIPVKSILSRTRKPKKVDTTSTVLEYYDLPYRYNQTIVKILAQTPSILFVYWDISDIDRENFIKAYGENFFNTTKPVLLVHNKTKNYTFEVEINDFANSWYLRMQEPDCEYEIELGRRSFEDATKYVYVTSSNKLVSPNDHVLFEKTDFSRIKFRNVKTGHIEQKDFGSLRLLTNIGNIYNQNIKHKVYRFYEEFYKDEVLESNKMFSNPSSGNPTSGMF